MSQLRAGDPAPDFNVQDLDGKPVRLSALKGKKVWLSFYRYAKCPLCNLFINQVASRMPSLKDKGVEVVAVFESKAERFPKYIGGKQTPFTIVSDPSKELYRLYKVDDLGLGGFQTKTMLMWLEAVSKGFPQPLPDGALGQIPGHFLIDERGIIKEAHYGRHIGDHIALEQVEAFAGLEVKAKQPSLSPR